MSFTRRTLLSQCAGIAAWAEIAAAQTHAHEAVKSGAPPQFQTLDAATAGEIEALTSQIIPSGESPGAREAGVVYFIDRALATFDADKKDVYRTGMAAIQEKRREMFPASRSVATLSSEQQIALIRAIERTPFFELLRTHTAYGFLGDPAYGGNRDKAGWKLIGFEDRMAYQPPFGYYDTPGNENQP